MSKEIKTRLLTPTEQKYTYAQSMQLEGQTGTIGHLRGDFATTGYGFYTTWFDTRPQWKSDEFKADLDTVINALREDKGLLHTQAFKGELGTMNTLQTSSLPSGSVCVNTVRTVQVLRRMWTTFCRAIRQGRCLLTANLSLCLTKHLRTDLSLPSSLISPTFR